LVPLHLTKFKALISTKESRPFASSICCQTLREGLLFTDCVPLLYVHSMSMLTQFYVTSDC